MNSFIKEQLQNQIKLKQEEYKAVSIQISEAIDLEQKMKSERKLKRIEEELKELESKLGGAKPSKPKNESTPTQITINNSGSMSGINIGSGTQTIQKHSGTGDNVKGDKIGRQINMGSGSTYIENPKANSQSPKANNQNPPNTKLKILFLAANPTDTTRLQTDKEYRVIRAELERGTQRDKYEFLLPQFSVTVSELIKAMNQKPNIVHFSGHGNEYKKLIITTENNESQPIPISALQRLFKPLQGITQIVLLNSCYSAEQAKVISEFGMVVVGNNDPIGDNAAISFAKGLYNGLGEGKSFEDAYNDAMITLLTENKDYAEVIEVWKDGKRMEL